MVLQDSLRCTNLHIGFSKRELEWNKHIFSDSRSQPSKSCMSYMIQKCDMDD